jgi:outer membrane protein assembly factor BamE (lipoprotein component of BamABCDE complex)
MRQTVIALAAFILVTPSCTTFTMGRKIDPEVMKKFKEGSTTKLEVLQELGDPFMRMADQNGNESWVYTYTESTAQVHPASFVVPFYTRVDSDTKSTSMTLTFRGDVLGTMAWGLPAAGRNFDEAAAASLPAGTTMEEAKAKLGEPQSTRVEPDGRTIWIYTYSAPAAAPMTPGAPYAVQTKSAELHFREGKLVR